MLTEEQRARVKIALVNNATINQEDKKDFIKLLNEFFKKDKDDLKWRIPVVARLVDLLPNWQKYVTVENIDSMIDDYNFYRKHPYFLDVEEPEAEIMINIVYDFVTKFCPENLWLLESSNKC